MTTHSTNYLTFLLSGFKRKNIFSFFMMFIAIVGFFNAFQYGRASLGYYSARNAINVWQGDSHVQTKLGFQNAKNAINSANTLHRSNPLYMELSGQIEEWGVVSGFNDKDGLIRAKFNYIQATKIRPLWPVTWANLAMIKWRLQEFDEEMLGYLSKANSLGPQSIEVHILFSRLGISLYRANNPMYGEIKDTVRSRIRLGLRNSFSRPPILSYIRSTKSMATVCRWMLLNDPYTAKKHLECPE